MAGKKYVLLVDHNSPFATAFRDQFLKKNPKVEMEVADNAKDALKHLGFKPCDLLIADLRLPEVDGLQLLLRLRRSYPHLTKVVMAANASPRDSQRAMDYGSVLYVEKPATPADYETAVDKVATILSKTPEILRGPLGELKLDEMVDGGDEPPKECVLVMYAEAGAGLLYLQGGRIIHAETPEKRGGDALKEMLTWQGGPFEKRGFQEPQKRTLDMPWEEVFTIWMEETRHAQAQAKPAAPAPVASAPAPVPNPKTAPLPAAPSIPAAAVKTATKTTPVNKTAPVKTPTAKATPTPRAKTTPVQTPPVKTPTAVVAKPKPVPSIELTGPITLPPGPGASKPSLAAQPPAPAQPKPTPVQTSAPVAQPAPPAEPKPTPRPAAPLPPGPPGLPAAPEARPASKSTIPPDPVAKTEKIFPWTTSPSSSRASNPTPAKVSSPAPAQASSPAPAQEPAKPTEPWVRVPAPTTMGVKPAPIGAPEEGPYPPAPRIPVKSGDSDRVALPAHEVTARVKPAPAEVAPTPHDVPLDENLIKSTGLRFALQIDAKGKVQQEIHCSDIKILIGVATFTAAKSKELGELFQWEPARSTHFVHDSVDMAVLPFGDRTVLLGWASGQESMTESINNVFGAGLLDPTSGTKPRLPATIDAMKKIPGLHGYAIFNKDHQLLVKKFSAQWSFDLLQLTSRITTQMCMVLQLQKLPVKMAQIKFDAGSIFAIPSGDLMLLTICHPQSKVPLLKDCLTRMSANEINKAVL